MPADTSPSLVATTRTTDVEGRPRWCGSLANAKSVRTRSETEDRKVGEVKVICPRILGLHYATLEALEPIDQSPFLAIKLGGSDPARVAPKPPRRASGSK